MRNTSLLNASLAAALLHAVAPEVCAQEIPAQTRIVVRTVEPIDSNNADLTREYGSGLDSPLIVNGITIAPRGSEAILRVVEAQRAGALSGRASLTLKLVGLLVNNQRIVVESSEVSNESASQGARAARGGVTGSVIGGAIGAILGGASGAAKGAAAGGVAGVSVVAVSGQRVSVPSETRLTFVLAKGVPLQSRAPANVADAPASGPAALPVPLAAPSQTSHSQVRFEVTSALAQGKTLTVTLAATNDGPDRPIVVPAEATQMIDDGGNAYRPSRIMIGNQESRAELVAGVRATVTITFNDLPLAGAAIQANQIARLRVHLQVGQDAQAGAAGGADLDFRNIAIRKN